MWGLFLAEPERHPWHCSKCGHSEFVHEDRDTRPCLYSNCECAGFQLVAAS
jgi:hypothetical protein